MIDRRQRDSRDESATRHRIGQLVAGLGSEGDVILAAQREAGVDEALGVVQSVELPRA